MYKQVHNIINRTYMYIIRIPSTQTLAKKQ